ncbi:MAG: ABC transporter permease subunit [Gordonia sp. (in: high G+C Gram-positive bacteria)]
MSTAALPVRRLTAILVAVLPYLGVLVFWTIASLVFGRIRVIPTPLAVMHALINDLGVYGTNIAATFSVAATGCAIGNAAAIVLGVLFVQFAWVERLLLRIAIASFCVPLVAIAPILVVVLPGDAPKVALAALSVFFTTLIAVILGLRAADPTSVHVIHSLGGNPLHILAKIRLFAMLPSLVAGLKISVPAALLGAIIGEYLGSSSGLGVMLVQAQSSFQIPRTWAVALVMSALAGLTYHVFDILGRLVTPWATQDVTLATASITAPAHRSIRVSAVISGVGALGSLTLVVAGWYTLITVFGLNHYFAKTPLDVVRYVTIDPQAPGHRAQIWAGLLITIRDAGTGFFFGTIAATLVAVLTVTFAVVARIVMPLAIALRSVPLVAMTPLLALVFGRGILGVTVIVSIVTFFPTLINVVSGLRSTPALATDIVRSLGGSDALATRKVKVLYALPAFFAAVRIAVPATLAGATLAEWLVTGKGIGAMLIQDCAASRFDALWTESAVIVLVSVAFYSAFGLIERPIITRFGVAPS